MTVKLPFIEEAWGSHTNVYFLPFLNVTFQVIEPTLATPESCLLYTSPSPRD